MHLEKRGLMLIITLNLGFVFDNVLPATQVAPDGPGSIIEKPLSH